MSLESEKIQHQLEEALKVLAEASEEGLVRQIRPILFTNLDRGRVHNFTEGKPDLVRAYVSRVAKTFAELSGYLHQLQSELNTEAWEALFERMQTWAYNFFLRKGFSANIETQEIAGECATEAALNLLTAHFPYDTDFDPWAHIIVQNACRKFIDRAFKKSAIPENRKVELDDNLVSADEVMLEFHALQQEDGVELLEALAQLTEARRSVIQSIYFEDQDAEEVALKMGKSVSAIYSLQFNALHDLRKILSTIRDNLNE